MFTVSNFSKSSIKDSEKILVSSVFDFLFFDLEKIFNAMSYADENFSLVKKDFLVGSHILSYEDLNHEMIHIFMNKIQDSCQKKNISDIEELLQGLTYFHSDFVYVENDSVFYDCGTVTLYHNGICFEELVEGDFISCEISLHRILSKVDKYLKNPIKR